MEFQRYLELDRILPAFKFRDIQTTATILAWTSANGFTAEDIRHYAVYYPFIEQLATIGYFVTGSVEHSQMVKDFEKTLPPDTKRTLRKERLARLQREELGKKKP